MGIISLLRLWKTERAQTNSYYTSSNQGFNCHYGLVGDKVIKREIQTRIMMTAYQDILGYISISQIELMHLSTMFTPIWQKSVRYNKESQSRRLLALLIPSKLLVTVGIPIAARASL